ncbi:phenol hydroxylase subunit P4 [Pseudomonas japonica]|uniref:phenol hydroxylase subunit P4 n=1 Tax=Pseudomonas japonica TaxID=256466 RepID=UPI003804F4D1
MPVIALNPGYCGEVRDAADQFNGQQVLFIEWAGHLSISAPIAVLVDPRQTFEDFVATLSQSVFATHPDWSAIDWPSVEWSFERRPLCPRQGDSFESLGVGHKAFIVLRTPHLNGV